MPRDLIGGLRALAQLACVWFLFLAHSPDVPLSHPDDVYVIAVGGDPHAGWDWYQAGWNPIARHFQTAGVMGADASLLGGDLFGERKSDLDGDRDWDCTVDRNWDWPVGEPCEYPSTWLASLYTTPRAGFAGPSWVVGGNHDGHPPIPEIASLSSPNEWWLTTVNPLAEDGVVPELSEVSHQLVRIVLPSGVWDVLLLHDLTWMQDRAVGGRCDLRDYSGLEALRKGCSTRGWPVGVVSDEQLIWLESAIADAALAGRHVVIATHAPAPNTVAFSTPGTAYVQACPGTPGTQAPVYVQSPDPSTHFPRDVDLLPNRTDLDAPSPWDPLGRTPIELAHLHVGSLVRWPENGPVDTAWGVELVQRYPGTVKVWLSFHNHLPVPDIVDSVGRGVRYDDAVSGTAFLATGALSWKWHTTVGAGKPQDSRLELHGDGTWAWQRWSVQTSALGLWPLGCTTSTSLPTTRPAPWPNLQVETGD